MKSIKKAFLLLCVMATASMGAADSQATDLTAFSTDFNSGMPAEFSGITTLEGVQGYAGIGTGSNIFSGYFLRNMSIPALKTTLTLTGLPEHTSVELNFLLAIIGSWDGSVIHPGNGPDYLNITVDGNLILSETFCNYNTPEPQSYLPPVGVQLTTRPFSELFSPATGPEAAYDLGLDPRFDQIAHTSSSLTIEWFASGEYQGSTDESWAIDNVEVILKGVPAPVPEPATMLLLASGLVGLAGVRRKFRKS